LRRTTKEQRRAIFLDMIEEFPVYTLGMLLGRLANSIDYAGIVHNKHPSTVKWRIWTIERILMLSEMAYDLYVMGPPEEDQDADFVKWANGVLNKQYDDGWEDFAQRLGLGSAYDVPCRPGAADSKANNQRLYGNHLRKKLQNQTDVKGVGET
jgi:hypothetical protein